MRFLRLGLLVGIVPALAACGQADEEADSNLDSLRSNPGTSVATTDTSVRLLGGYNAFLDRATAMQCATPKDPVQPEIGQVEGSFYLRHVNSREELAKELDVEVGAKVTAPQASIDASTKVVKNFKQSSTTVSFLVRAVRSYTATNRAPIALAPQARDMLASGATTEFLQKCGGSFAQTVRYDAQVLAILQFEAQTEESARQIKTSLGGGTSGALKKISSASAEVKTAAQETASKNNAQLSITVSASGFLTNGQTSAGALSATFEQIDALRAEMNKSFDADLASDRSDYFGNRARNVRPALVGQASYALVEDAPADADYTRLTTTLTRAEEFVRGIAPVYLRMETAHDNEVMEFLGDPNQYRYNLASNPKLKAQDLVPIAQKWATRFGPDGSRENGSLVEPLRLAIDRCTSAAANGNYAACTTDPMTNGDKAEAEKALAEYARSGRIVPVSASMLEPGKTYSYWSAVDACEKAAMRLPRRDELNYIGPMVSALASPKGEIWFAGDEKCKKPYFVNTTGRAATGCMDTWNEPLPWVEDRPVICVSRSGPVMALTPP